MCKWQLFLIVMRSFLVSNLVPKGRMTHICERLLFVLLCERHSLNIIGIFEHFEFNSTYGEHVGMTNLLAKVIRYDSTF